GLDLVKQAGEGDGALGTERWGARGACEREGKADEEQERMAGDGPQRATHSFTGRDRVTGWTVLENVRAASRASASVPLTTVVNGQLCARRHGWSSPRRQRSVNCAD